MRQLLRTCIIVCHVMIVGSCGGFFCSLSAPVDQASEQIVFAVDGNEVIAHIRIQYRGPSREFSWVLPLPTPPKLDVGSNVFFDELTKRTAPQFRLKTQQPTTNDPQCNEGGFPADNGGSDTGGATPTTENNGVEVIEEGQVGPFDFALLLALKGNAQDVVDWLNVEGYDQPQAAPALLQQYAEYNFTFLALRLSKNSNSGDIQPLVVKYWFKENIEASSCIPLKLTSVSAIPNMPVYVWVLGRARAVPVNFLEMTLDHTKFDWMNCAWSNQGDFARGCVDCQQHYLDLVTQLADKAQGHSFITEYSGTPNIILADWDPLVNFNLRTLQNTQEVHAFIEELQHQGIPASTLTQEIIKKWIPYPQAARVSNSCGTEQLFYAAWNINLCVAEYMPEDWKFNPTGLAADINDRIVEPIRDAISLLGKFPVLTRMFTTISPKEMTTDPLFVFDATLPLVPILTEANAIITCPQQPDPDPEALTVQISMQEAGKNWAFNGRWKGCEFMYDPPLQLNTSTPRLFKRTGTPSTSGEIAVGMTDAEEIKNEISNTLVSLRNIAMDLMPDNAWSEIPNNDDFKNRSPLGITIGTREPKSSDDDKKKSDDDSDDSRDSKDDNNRNNSGIKLVVSHILFVAVLFGYFFW